MAAQLMHRLIVWTSFRASPAEVWQLATDPSELAAALPGPVRWEISDPEGLRSALRQGQAGPFASRLRAFGQRADCPVHVLDALEHRRCAWRADNAWLSPWEHRLRFERAIGDRTRLVHEVLFEPQRGPRALVVWLVRRAIVHVHREFARRLPADEERTACSRLDVLVDANLAHADDPLGTHPFQR